MREKEEIKERQKERIQKLEEKKKLIASQKNVEHKSEVKTDFTLILTPFRKKSMFGEKLKNSSKSKEGSFKKERSSISILRSWENSSDVLF